MDTNDRKRRLKSGNEFDHLFPLPSNTDRRIKGNADVEDTLKLIRSTVPQTLWQTEKIARVLKGKTLDETCSNIWHFVYEHIQYKRDEDGVEQVRSPRRTWWERKSGVDCDCYTEFISSILLNLDIPHKARITKYPKTPPEIPRWQHIYPIVPRDGRLNYDLSNRDDYIVIDCVKDNYDDEQSFLERKDYDMRLDFLDGIDQENEVKEYDVLPEYEIPELADFADLSSVYSDEELELGNIFKKVAKGVKKVAVKTATKVASAAKTVAKNVKKTAPVLLKKVGEAAKKVVRVIAKVAVAPLRAGLLLAMKLNIKNLGGRLRYAYLSDQEAAKKNINPNALKDLRKVKDRAENIYYQAGGKKSNLAKAILKGKGNKDKAVPMLAGLDGLNEYADEEEYRIVNTDNVEGLGVVATTSLAAASAAIAAIATALKGVKGLFNKGGKEEQAFSSETDNATNEREIPANIPDDEDAIIDEPVQSNEQQQSYSAPASYSAPSSYSLPALPAPQKAEVKTYVSPAYIPQSTTTIPKPPPQLQVEQRQEQEEQQTITNQETMNEEQDSAPTDTGNKSVLPDRSSSGRGLPSASRKATENTTLPAKVEAPKKEEGFIQKTTGWVKENPGKSLLITGAITTGAYLLVKALSGNKNKAAPLNGTPKKKSKSKGSYQYKSKIKIQRHNLL
jgi:hypothetical protein